MCEIRRAYINKSGFDNNISFKLIIGYNGSHHLIIFVYYKGSYKSGFETIFFGQNEIH